MGAVTIVPQHGPIPAGPLIDRSALVALVLVGSVLIVALGFFVVLLDRVTDREMAAAKITHLAYHDALTGLSNRPMLDHHLTCSVEQATATGESLAVICVDLDGFKVVNDSHGHGAGDLLLVEVARRIQSVVRSNELVARIGGDEFIIVQRGGIQPRDAGSIAERVIGTLRRPYTISGTTILIGASAGIAMFPADAGTPADLTMKADAALYLAKEAGRGVLRFYHSSMEDIFHERRELENSMAGAIRDNLFTVHYQPIADLNAGRIAGFEALLRWEHPELGIIQPDAFIGIAEQKGLIGELGMWVLEKACRDAAIWDPPLQLAVNFSPLQFLEEDLANRVAAVLEQSGLDPSRLEIEVTENVLIARPEQALGIFNNLKALGVRVCLDDFGTGYSSLGYFRVFPFDKVKIDRSFVLDLAGTSAREIVRSIIDLSLNLGITVVAEGVETEAQLEALRELRCQQVQGYLIGRPNPIEVFDRTVLSSLCEEPTQTSRSNEDRGSVLGRARHARR